MRKIIEVTLWFAVFCVPLQIEVKSIIKFKI